MFLKEEGGFYVSKERGWDIKNRGDEKRKGGLICLSAL